MEEKIGIWLILDLFVRIITMLAVVIILSKYHQGIILTLLIILFIAWAFRPFYLSFKNFIKDFPKKKVKLKKNNISKLNNIIFLLYLVIFALSIFLFLMSVIYLGKAVHPLTITFSFILSSALIFLYYYFTKREFKGVLWSFSKLFLLATICLFISVLFFASHGLVKGINTETKNISVDVYVVNGAISLGDLNSSLIYSQDVWKKYNISLFYPSVIDKNVNLTNEELKFLYDKGNNEEECLNYSKILSKIIDNSTNPKLIFLNKFNSTHAGRGSLCGQRFALVDVEKSWIFDFTGWNVAHEMGHVFGLLDIQYYGRIKMNLMNDEFKRFFIFKSDFLDQPQLDIVTKSFDDLIKKGSVE